MGEELLDWTKYASKRQLQLFDTLGSRPYDEIEKSNLFLLKKKVGFATCGKPTELPSCSNYNTGYTTEQLEHIKSLCSIIIEKSNCDPIRFACTILILNHKKEICETPVFRIVTSTGNIFIDTHCRVYQDWSSFMENNKLPECEYCYPINGEYNTQDVVGFAMSPACSVISKATDCLDTAGSIASIGAASVMAAGFFVAVAPAAAAVARNTALCTGVYSLSRNVCTLVDRKKHEQSIGLSDRESRSVWMNIASSATGALTAAAVGKAQKVFESGKQLGKLSEFGVRALNATSLAFSGFGFVEQLKICKDRYNKGVLTKKDIFDLSCELLFLFNAIASAKATTNLINTMFAAAVETPVQRKLTKTQKRNMRKRAAKRRTKGLTLNVTEESKSTSNFKIQPAIQLLIIEAAKSYAPRVEEILFTCQSIGHDIKCWQAKEISGIACLNNVAKKITCLFDRYKEEVSDAITKVVKYISSLKFDEIKEKLKKIFQNASEQLKNIFCTKVINMEDQVETVVDEAERDIINLYSTLGIDLEDATPDFNNDEADNFDDNGLNPETQKILVACEHIAASSQSCNNLEDFGDILVGVKYTIVHEFKSKIAWYKVSLEAAKSASANSFDINVFHNILGVKGDVGQYYFNETLQELEIGSGSLIYKIKNKCKEVKKNRSTDNMTSAVWEALTEGIYHYYGPHGKGDLSKKDLLSFVCRVIDQKTPLSEETCTFLEDKDFIMIELNDKPDVHIVICCDINEENTASGLIFIVK